MYDKRNPLKEGSVISHNGVEFKIKELIGRGGNAIVYKAEYADSLIEGGIHQCVIKELFPFHRNGGVYRGEDGSLEYEEDARDFFEMHRQSFLHGNAIHLHILGNSPDSVGVNVNSFEENNTIYTVLGLNSIKTLKQKCGTFENLSEILQIIIKLLKAVEVFHKNNILHLDISPENVILSPSNGEERVLLIDFNSCQMVDGGLVKREGYMSINPEYSAPELKLGRRRDISEATDVFSVCAVFVYLLSGENFVYALTRLKRLTKLRILKTVPQSAVSCLMSILTKGLRSRTSLRYRTAADMIEACAELQSRIDNIGITHGSLWEASRLMCGADNTELVENSILCDGKRMSSERLSSLGSTVITGEGGIGKTTLFKQLWHKSTRVYRPNKPVVFYIPLNRYDGKTDFIKRYIVSKIKFGAEISTVTDAVQRLVTLMNRGGSFIYLMLDGYNEIKADGGDIIREIRELDGMSGVTVTVSARSDTLTGEYLKTFKQVTLLPLGQEQVREYLNKRTIAYPDDAELKTLLANPLMLTLYAKTEKVFRKNGEMHSVRATQKEIIDGYIESIAETYRQSAPEDKNGQARLSYVLKFLFPALCAEAKKHTTLDFKEVRAVCKANYKRLKSRAFQRVFKEYSGKSREIIGGAANEDEWLNLALNTILIDETALVVKENDTYYPLHMNFTDCLAEEHKRNMRRYRKSVIGLRVPIAAALTAVCIGAGGTVYYYTPGTHPIGSREIRNNNEIMTVVMRSVSNIVQMTLEEELLIDQLDRNDTDKSLQTIKTIGKRLDALGEAKVTIENLKEKSYLGLDTERVEKILAMSESHRNFQRKMFGRIEYALSSGVYTEQDIQDELDNYREYLSEYERLTAYELCLLTKGINDKGAAFVKDSMRGSGGVVKSFSGALEMSRGDLEGSVKNMEMDLKMLEARLELIQSEE